MKIALIGTRGVPARYGGFETCAEELGRRLVRMGHEVRVYCRTGYYEKNISEYLGMTLVRRPALPVKFFETLSHTALSLLHACTRRTDILMVFNSANSPLLILPAWLGKKIALNTDGLEWKREKWRGLGRIYYRTVERLAAHLPVPLISDSHEIGKYFRKTYGRETRYITYGAPLEESRRPELLERFGLRPGNYFLQMARFEPENNIHLTIRAFEKIETDMTLAIVGGAKYRSKYVEELYAVKDPRVRFLGFCYEEDILRELLCNAFVYIHGNAAGGTNPGLLQAMGAGAFIIACDVSFNREVCADAALYFDMNGSSLRDKMIWAVRHPAALAPMKNAAKRIVRERYDWDAVAAEYDKLFSEMAVRPVGIEQKRKRLSLSAE